MAVKLDRAIKSLRACHPRARFFQVGEVAAGQTDNEDEEQKFHYVSLYEHKITNSFEPLRGHLFIISNGFLASHIYNFALVWIWYNCFENKSSEWLDAALRHNMKKFFAECLLAERNILMGRALLIETLMYEQDLMKPIFSAIEEKPTLKQIAEDLAYLMSITISHHELGHYFLHRSVNESRKHFMSFFSGKLKLLIDKVFDSFEQESAEAISEEIICDAVAANHSIKGENEILDKYDEITRARMTAFHFMVFTILVSLEKSAHATAYMCAEEDAVINLSSEKRPKFQFSFSQGLCRDTDFRANEIIKLIATEFESKGKSLFGENGSFPLSIKTLEIIRYSFDRFAEEISPLDGGLTGTDIHRRGLAQLLAESLHGHDHGAEFLLWRSKKFSVGGEAIDP
jgi:hypothetical protein